MKQPEQLPSPEEMKRAFRDMQIRMRNYALHHLGKVDARTLTVLQDLDLFEGTTTPIGVGLDIAVLRDASHPRRVKLPPGPLLVYITEEDKPKRMVVEIPMLVFSEIGEIRKAALASVENMIAGGNLTVIPRTLKTLKAHHDALMADDPHQWRQAAVAVTDVFHDDILVALQGARQCLEAEPVIQSSLDLFVPRVIRPALSSLDTITLEPANPEQDHARLGELVRTIAANGTTLQGACNSYYAALGHLPLAPRYSLNEVVAQWLACHPRPDVWSEVWTWADSIASPTPKYHACLVFVLQPDLIPADRLTDLWKRILDVVCGSDEDSATGPADTGWRIRRDLARHYGNHLEANLPDNDGANIWCFAWWLAEKAAALFPDTPDSAKFYHDNWVVPAADRSGHVWLIASARVGRSYLRYISSLASSPWAIGLLAALGPNMERLLATNMPAETQRRFHNALVSHLIACLPVQLERLEDPTFSPQCSVEDTALQWAHRQTEENKKALLQLVATSRELNSIEGLCKAIQKIDALPLVDQLAISMALNTKAYLDPSTAEAVWGVLSNTEWRTRVFESLEERVLAILFQGLTTLQIDNRAKWFTVFPHYLAEACEKSRKPERRRELFLCVIQASLASDTVSALQQLLRGPRKADFVDIVKEYRARIESMWPEYPPWVQGRLRAILASLHVV